MSAEQDNGQSKNELPLRVIEKLSILITPELVKTTLSDSKSVFFTLDTIVTDEGREFDFSKNHRFLDATIQNVEISFVDQNGNLVDFAFPENINYFFREFLMKDLLEDTFNCLDFAKYLHGIDTPGHHLNNFFDVGAEVSLDEINFLPPGTPLLIATKDTETGKKTPDHVVINLAYGATISLFGTSGALLVCPSNEELYKNFGANSTWVLNPKAKD